MIKAGVDIEGIRPELALELALVIDVYRAFGQRFRLTSVMDGKHRDNSLHYKGLAADVGVVHILDKTKWKPLAAAIQVALGSQFDVVLEDNPAHIHIEWDPKPKAIKV